jgi:hypothetical protein
MILMTHSGRAGGDVLDEYEWDPRRTKVVV